MRRRRAVGERLRGRWRHSSRLRQRPAAARSPHAAAAEAKSFKLDHEHVYLSTDRAGKFLLGIHYASGATNVYPLDAAGMPGPRVQAIQERYGPGHCVLTSPDGRFLAVTGYESSTLMVYAIAADGGLTRAATLPWDERITDVIAR
jgi:6-phosphogluconolactonase (cycloisomerase 2 family)